MVVNNYRAMRRRSARTHADRVRVEDAVTGDTYWQMPSSKYVTVTGHANSHDVTYLTARKDLQDMESAGLLSRVRVGKAHRYFLQTRRSSASFAAADRCRRRAGSVAPAPLRGARVRLERRFAGRAPPGC